MTHCASLYTNCALLQVGVLAEWQKHRGQLIKSMVLLISLARALDLCLYMFKVNHFQERSSLC